MRRMLREVNSDVLRVAVRGTSGEKGGARGEGRGTE
jgi:hypothetical protein